MKTVIFLNITFLFMFCINTVSYGQFIKKNQKQTSLSTILDAEGKIISGAQGSFSAEGMQMNYGKNGEPIFSPNVIQDSNSWSALGSLTGGKLGIYSDEIYCIAINGNDIYIGGYFSHAGGVLVNNIAKWNGSTWTALGSGITGFAINIKGVFTISINGNDLYAGGCFDTAGGIPVKNIAKWNGVNWSALGSGITHSSGTAIVYASIISGEYLYVGGSFGMPNGMNRIAKWNGTNWSALGSGLSGVVFALAINGNDLYVGGSFAIAVGTADSLKYIAKWNGTNLSAVGSGISSYLTTIYAIAVNENNIYIGGHSASLNNYVLKYNGSVWLTLGSSSLGSSDVKSIAVSGNDIYAGGSFDNAIINGVEIKYLVKWDGTNWSLLGGGVNTDVNAIAVSGNNIYAVGKLWTAQNSSQYITINRIGKWNGTAWSALSSGVSGPYSGYVLAIAVNGNDIYVGGSFTLSQENIVNYIAKWNGSTWSALGTGINGMGTQVTEVTSITINGNDVYVGGRFSTAGDIPVNNIAKWDGTTWSALGTGVTGGLDHPVDAICIGENRDVYVGGYFNIAGGIPAARIAKWDGENWSAMGSGFPGISDYVEEIAILGNRIYAGGSFTLFNGKNIAVWNESNSTWSSPGGGLSGGSGGGYVTAMTVSGQELYVTGTFRVAGTDTAQFIAKWNGSNWSAVGSGPGTSFHSGSVIQVQIRTVAVMGNKVFIGGGDFLRINNDTVNNIAMWDGISWSALKSGIRKKIGPYEQVVWSMAISESNLIVGGFFFTAGGVPVNNIARWGSTTAPSAPTNLSYNILSIGKVKLTWNDNSKNEDSYQMQRRKNTDTNWDVMASIPPNATQWIDSGLTVGNMYSYRVRALNFTGSSPFSDTVVVLITDVENNNELPMEYALYQNYPNPFNPTTQIKFDLPKQGLVTLKIFDILGREVAVLVNEIKPAGRYEVNFNASAFSSGVYFYKLESNDFSQVKRMLLVK